MLKCYIGAKIERGSSKSLLNTKNISDRFRPVPGSLSRCTATLHLGAPGQTRAFGEERGQLSRGGCAERRFRRKKINWADVIRSIPTIRLCTAFIRDVRTNRRSGPLSSITGAPTTICSLPVLFRNDLFFTTITSFRWSTDIRGSQNFISSMLELGSGCSLSSFFLFTLVPFIINNNKDE